MEEEKRIMSRAQRRKEKKPVEIVTQAHKDAARERTRELRKELRMLKSNGYRRKVRKMLAQKREREVEQTEEVEATFTANEERPKHKRRVEGATQVKPTEANPFAKPITPKPTSD
eukprot:GILI01019545.1.p1 GENE.GILI01019545.1~~GILI01019545.1.p1  ORF type:complete len:115 (+),score=23.44 GILI01019545.1:36-380(+)